ncbi:sensor histidine kinase [Streptomyces phaeofaciens]|uniref:sensor histidine kinase n=1 Tax=Streptomyces phaeofaciens TaxID=68254 RepID=UPI0036A12A2A
MAGGHTVGARAGRFTSGRAAAPGERAARLRAVAVDLAPAVVLLAAMAAVRLGPRPEDDGPLPAALALAVVIAGSLALRRRAPLTAYAAGTAGLAVEALWVDPGPLTPVANLIGVYHVGLHATPGRARLGALLVLPGVLAYFAPGERTAPVPVAVVFVWLLVWAAGYAAARRNREAQERAAQRHREAVLGERVRIARELHDIVGHSVNAMVVQAGAGRMVLGAEPDRTRELLLSVERTGRDALAELDRLLGVLRADDGTDPDGEDDPAGLGRLVRPLADAGMAVRLRIAPEVHDLPPAVRSSVHRIVQEALTNALRHGRARAAEVTVSRDADTRTLLVRVLDDGDGPAPHYRPGRGLRGIGERAAALGGGVEHGPGDDGGFALSVAVPLP